MAVSPARNGRTASKARRKPSSDRQRNPSGRRRTWDTAESIFPSPRAIIPNVIAGTFAGLLTALGGALKDTPYEGFKPTTFYRSIWVGALAGVVTSAFTDSFWVSFMCSGYLERVAVEGYKIVRAQMPGKFEHGGVGHNGPTGLLPHGALNRIAVDDVRERPRSAPRPSSPPPSSPPAELRESPTRFGPLPAWETAA